MILSILRRVYRLAFAHPGCYRFNLLMHDLSLRGLGVLNHENDDVTGENSVLAWALARDANTASEPLVVLDVGANVGNFARRVKAHAPDAQVFAFEPHPATFVRTRDAAREAGFFAVNAACGETRGMMTLYDYHDAVDGSQHASLYRGVIEELHHRRAVGHQVSVITVDDFVAEQGLRKVRLLKIDTEGHEASVLRGAKQTIEQGIVELIQFEFNSTHVASRTFFKDFVDLLADYTLYRLLPNGLIELTYSPARCEIFAFQNVLAVRAGVQVPMRRAAY